MHRPLRIAPCTTDTIATDEGDAFTASVMVLQQYVLSVRRMLHEPMKQTRCVVIGLAHCRTGTRNLKRMTPVS